MIMVRSYGYKCVLPLHPGFDEGMKIKRATGNDEMESLSNERESHGTWRENPISAVRISPPPSLVTNPYD